MSLSAYLTKESRELIGDRAGFLAAIIGTIILFVMYYVSLYPMLSKMYYAGYSPGLDQPVSNAPQIRITTRFPHDVANFVEREIWLSVTNTDPHETLGVQLMLRASRPTQGFVLVYGSNGSDVIDFGRIPPNSAVSRVAWIKGEGIGDVEEVSYTLLGDIPNHPTGAWKPLAITPNSDFKSHHNALAALMHTLLKGILLPPWANGVLPAIALLVVLVLDNQWGEQNHLGHWPRLHVQVWLAMLSANLAILFWLVFVMARVIAFAEINQWVSVLWLLLLVVGLVVIFSLVTTASSKLRTNEEVKAQLRSKGRPWRLVLLHKDVDGSVLGLCVLILLAGALFLMVMGFVNVEFGVEVGLLVATSVICLLILRGIYLYSSHMEYAILQHKFECATEAGLKHLGETTDQKVLEKLLEEAKDYTLVTRAYQIWIDVRPDIPWPAIYKAMAKKKGTPEKPPNGWPPDPPAPKPANAHPELMAEALGYILNEALEQKLRAAQQRQAENSTATAPQGPTFNFLALPVKAVGKVLKDEYAKLSRNWRGLSQVERPSDNLHWLFSYFSQTANEGFERFARIYLDAEQELSDTEKEWAKISLMLWIQQAIQSPGEAGTPSKAAAKFKAFLKAHCNEAESTPSKNFIASLQVSISAEKIGSMIDTTFWRNLLQETDCSSPNQSQGAADPA